NPRRNSQKSSHLTGASKVEPAAILQLVAFPPGYGLRQVEETGCVGCGFPLLGDVAGEFLGAARRVCGTTNGFAVYSIDSARPAGSTAASIASTVPPASSDRCHPIRPKR